MLLREDCVATKAQSFQWWDIWRLTTYTLGKALLAIAERIRSETRASSYETEHEWWVMSNLCTCSMYIISYYIISYHIISYHISIKVHSRFENRWKIACLFLKIGRCETPNIGALRVSWVHRIGHRLSLKHVTLKLDSIGLLVGRFNPFEKYWSIWIISSGRG